MYSICDKPALKRFHLKFNSLVCQYTHTYTYTHTHTHTHTLTHYTNTHSHTYTHTHTHTLTHTHIHTHIHTHTYTNTHTHTHNTCLNSNAIKPVQIVSIFACLVACHYCTPLTVLPGILKDKEMADKLMYIPN